MKYLTLATLLLSFNLFAKGGDPDCVNCNGGEEQLQIASRRTQEFAKALSDGVVKGQKYEDKISICNNFTESEFKKVITYIENELNKSLEDIYFKIKCDNVDLLSLYIEEPVNLQFVGWDLEDYFLDNINVSKDKAKKLKTMFSKILLNEVEGMNAIQRIDKTLQLSGLTSGEKVALNDMKRKYCDYLNNIVDSCKKS